jgi:hypothetical protein
MTSFLLGKKDFSAARAKEGMKGKVKVAPLVEMNCLRESFMRVKLHKRYENQNTNVLIFSAFGSFCKYGS